MESIMTNVIKNNVLKAIINSKIKAAIRNGRGDYAINNVEVNNGSEVITLGSAHFSINSPADFLDYNDGQLISNRVGEMHVNLEIKDFELKCVNRNKSIKISEITLSGFTEIKEFLMEMNISELITAMG